jgi:hypothetical protein
VRLRFKLIGPTREASPSPVAARIKKGLQTEATISEIPGTSTAPGYIFVQSITNFNFGCATLQLSTRERTFKPWDNASDYSLDVAPGLVTVADIAYPHAADRE